MWKIILGLVFVSSVASAARIEDVKILDVASSPEKIQLKLQVNYRSKDSYFYVDITRRDPASFEKLAHVIKKLMKKEKYKLDLKIISFSASPNGSHYNSDRVTFY